MKKLILGTILLCNSVFVCARISQSEYNQLTSEQKAIYDRQCQQIEEDIKDAKNDLYKAEQLIQLGKEMKSDNAKYAGAAYIAQGMELQESAEKALRNALSNQELLDTAAREAITNNKK